MTSDLYLQGIVPTGVTEEVTELLVTENKLDLALSDASTLPTLGITKVTSHVPSMVPPPPPTPLTLSASISLASLLSPHY